MCGIIGIYSLFELQPKPVSPVVLDQMLSCVRHRGPDGGASETIGRLTLGHRRLRIIDLAGGKQPLWSHDGRYVISFNGEIFNYLELRQELKDGGAVFKTASDTEVIIEAFRRWGEGAFARFNGQFAFALYDKDTGDLFLARDRMGEKPLYYAEISGSIVFASELKPILAYFRANGFSVDLNHQAVVDFLSLNYVPGNETFDRRIVQVSPGAFLRIVKGVRAEVRYISQNRSALSIASSSAAAPRITDEFETLLQDAVAIRLRSDVPVGVFLSGGLDSTTIATALRSAKLRAQTGNTKAFIAHFPEEGFSEAPNAKMVCEALGIPFEVFDIDPGREDIPALIQALVEHGDEPLADSSALPVYLLSRETAKQVKVVLSGEGGDELFAGYLTYRATLIAQAIPKPVRALLSRFQPLTRLLFRDNEKVGLGEMSERFLRSINLSPGAAHFAWNGMFSAQEKQRLLHPDFITSSLKLDTFESLAKRLLPDPNRVTLHDLLLADQLNYLVNDILAKSDRMTLAHGLEARPVFMDYRLVEFARSLPNNLLRCGGQGKIIMRKYLARRLPQYPQAQRKQGFSIPIHLWFRTVLKDFAGDLFSSEFTRACGVYNQQYLLELWHDHQSQKRRIGFELWGIMVSLLWLKKFYEKL